MADDFRISELATLAPGFAWPAPCAVARGLEIHTCNNPSHFQVKKLGTVLI